MQTTTNLAQLTISDPNKWTKDELYANLQAAVDVELWTIPLYLTALYSIQGLNNGSQSTYPAAAKLIESVVIEEMLHLQLACNICNALGYSPQMPLPVYNQQTGIPFLKYSVPAKYADFEVRLGGLDVNQLKLFCVVELPEETKPIDWSTQTKYNSIGELYQALEIAIKAQWDTLYVGEENNTKQQANFTDYLARFNAGAGFSQIINDLDTALAAMEAIVGQGEGNRNGNEIPAVDQPPQQTPQQAQQDYDPSDYDPADSHFLKFNQVLDMLLNGSGAPGTYPLIPQPDAEQLALQQQSQAALDMAFQGFIQQLQEGFSTAQPTGKLPNSFFTNMFNMQALIAAVWQSGAVPSFPVPSAS